MNEKGKELSYFELLEKIKDLSGLEKRYYNYLPDRCTRSEDLQAKEMKIGRKKLRRVKRNLINEGILELIPLPNGKRKNPKHLLLKRDSIILRDRDALYLRHSIDDDYIDDYRDNYINDIDWSLLQSYTADDINKMSKLDKVQLYQECGFIVLPTHYPEFTDKGVKCSCRKGFNCPNKGKHPIFSYGYLNGFNYEYKKEKYFNDFKNNPKLNAGFKVMGFGVLDVDFRYNGDVTLNHLMQEYEFDLKGFLKSKSGNGNHYFVKNTNFKNTPNALGTGLDTRGDGGFIMAPGSTHHTGKIYEWDLIGELGTLPIDAVEFQSNTDEENNKSFNNNFNSETIKMKLNEIVLPKTPTSDYVIKEGTRELTLFKWAARERGKGAIYEQIYDSLITIRDTYCEEGEAPITDEEIKDIAHSASKYPTNQEKWLMPMKP